MRIDRITRNRAKAAGSARMRSSATFVAAMACLVTVGQAVAAPQTLSARLDTSQVSFFTLDFGEYGGERAALLSNTTFRLEIDADLQSARFLSYEQEIDPIMLPDGAGGDISTGNIRVEVVPGTSSGVFDRSTGEFTTSETYAVYFEGDLSAFGIESPVLLPSESNGTIAFNRAAAGSIGMQWFGSGVLANFLPFHYACTVNTLFRTFEVAIVRPTIIDPVGLIGGFGERLAMAQQAFDLGYVDSALEQLDAFIVDVKLERGASLSEGVADALIDSANEMIAEMSAESAESVSFPTRGGS